MLLSADRKRIAIVQALRGTFLTIDGLATIKNSIDEKGVGLILEAMEAISNNNPTITDLKWLEFAEEYVSSKNNTGFKNYRE